MQIGRRDLIELPQAKNPPFFSYKVLLVFETESGPLQDVGIIAMARGRKSLQLMK